MKKVLDERKKVIDDAARKSRVDVREATEWVYDEAGQLRTGSMVDYLVPTAADLPTFELAATVTPSPVNPLGTKGVGEAGTIASSAAVINAVVDALAPFGVKDITMPATPEKVWQLMHRNGGTGR